LSTYQGLEKLVLDLIPFNLEEVKEKYVEVARLHNKTLKYIGLQKNAISNDFMQYLCEQIAAENIIDMVELTHMKDNKDIDWVRYFKSLNLLAQNSKKIVTVILNGYQIESQQKAIQEYLEKDSPMINLNVRNDSGK